MQSPSSGLFGRDRELTEADEALSTAASGVPQALLVGGDAGIGKTTLVARIGERARERGFTVLTGHCLDIDTGVPLQPVREALRPAISVTDQLGPASARVSGFVLDGLSPESETPGSILDQLGQVVAELATAHPVLLVLEDMHWADGSTRDLAVSVARTMHGPVCLLLTYRADELTRRHPFRRALVEIGRSVGARRLELAPLEREGISGIVKRCTGQEDTALVGEVLARSEGNPLYAEELLLAGASSLPGPLSDLLLARVDALEPATRDLLRLASVNGTRLDLDLLASVAGADPDTVEGCLHEAMDANVLRRAGEHLEFRHGLLREAVYDDLLPGERNRAHAQVAGALRDSLDDHPDLAALGTLAFHWYAAHDLPAAYDASVKAGRAARTYGGPEAVTHLGRALELYDRVPHDGAEGDPARADLLRLLAEACKQYNEHDRSEQLIREALTSLDPETDRLLASRVYSSYASLCREFEGHLGHYEAVELAVTYAQGRPSEELATALSTMALWHVRHETYSTGLELANQALAVCAEVDLPVLASTTQQVMGWALFSLGRVSEALATFEAAVEPARRGGGIAEAMEAEAAHADLLIFQLDWARGVADTRALRERAQAAGLPEVAADAGVRVAGGLMLHGRLDEAELILSELVEDQVRADNDFWRYFMGYLRLLKGEPAAALPLARASIETYRKVAVPANWFNYLHLVEVLVANGQLEEARAALDLGRVIEDSEGACSLGGLAHAGYLILAAEAAAGRAGDEELMSWCDRLLDRGRALMTEEGARTWEGTYTTVAVALRADLVGDPSADAWRAAYDACSPVGPGHALQSGLGLAAALLAAGERDEARLLLPELWVLARSMGAKGFEAEAARLARRHRIALPGDDGPTQLDVLTAREREVLDVLVTGATNRVIAERLFISEKTVSVHVTNLLAKLGVSNRGEAAALARELAPAD